LRGDDKAAMQLGMTAPDPDRLLAEIGELVARFAPAAAAIERGTELTSDLSIDSVAAMDLVMEIEDRYGIDVPVNEIADLVTVGDLVDLVARQLGARA
jgi:acyl carrier protein